MTAVLKADFSTCQLVLAVTVLDRTNLKILNQINSCPPKDLDSRRGAKDEVLAAFQPRRQTTAQSPVNGSNTEHH